MIVILRGDDKVTPRSKYKDRKTTKNNMDMKTLKIINGIVWAVIAIVLNALVVYYWSDMGCPVKSLVLACIAYTAFCACLWYAFHALLKDIEKRL